MSNLPKIFVAIASYRDPECQHTVRDLFAKAAHPERISVGICWQFCPEEDKDCFEYAPPFPQQVRASLCHYQKTLGGCWARAQALGLAEDEDYVLQIDAHMRFVAGWDNLLLEEIAKCPSERAILTLAAPSYWPPDKLESPKGRLLIGVQELGKPDDPQLLHLNLMRWDRRQSGTEPLPCPFFIANFLFAPARVFRETPYDPHIYFRGQEPVYSARLWTHGWDIFQPDATIAYHYWNSVSRAKGTGVDYKAANEQALRGRQRVWHLLGIQTASDPQVLKDLRLYGMGRVRTLAEFWKYAGVDPVKGTITPDAKRGYWPPYRQMAMSTSFSANSFRASPTEAFLPMAQSMPEE